MIFFIDTQIKNSYTTFQQSRPLYELIKKQGRSKPHTKDDILEVRVPPVNIGDSQGYLSQFRDEPQ
jgi:hypothetical protein